MRHLGRRPGGQAEEPCGPAGRTPVGARRPSIALTVTLALAAGLFGGSARGQIPPRPAGDGDGALTHDLAGVIGTEGGRRIAEWQREALERADTPIVVVTIRSISDHATTGTTIEALARDWFDAWEVGKADWPRGAGKGALVLVSVSDRRARIELGRDWGRRWEAHCAGIMDRHMIPRFQAADHSAAIAAGVAGLRGMAALGPSADPPGAARAGRGGVGGWIARTSQFGLPVVLAAFALMGLALFGGWLGLSTKSRMAQVFLASGMIGFLLMSSPICLFVGFFTAVHVYEGGATLRSGGFGGSTGSYGGSSGSSSGFGGVGSSGGGGASGGW